MFALVMQPTRTLFRARALTPVLLRTSSFTLSEARSVARLALPRSRACAPAPPFIHLAHALCSRVHSLHLGMGSCLCLPLLLPVALSVFVSFKYLPLLDCCPVSLSLSRLLSCSIATARVLAVLCSITILGLCSFPLFHYFSCATLFRLVTPAPRNASSLVRPCRRLVPSRCLPLLTAGAAEAAP